VGVWGRHAAGATLALPAERPAMRVHRPRLKIDVRVNRSIAEEVIDER
jgi:hypothetical protein